MAEARPKVVRVCADVTIPEPELQLVADAGADFEIYSAERASVPGALSDVDVVINASHMRFTPSVIAGLDRCRAIIQASVGYDLVDVPAATARDIVVSNLPDYCVEEVSDHAVALALALARKLHRMERLVRDGEWAAHVDTLAEIGRVDRLRDRTLGIIGLGNIGRLVARKSVGLFGRLIGADPYVKPEVAAQSGVELLSLEDVLKQADYVTLHVLLTKETRHLINAERLAVMKPTAYLVNTCRGPVVDEPALIAALRDGRIAGAGLDVFETEPIDGNHPLAKMENVIVTPHTAVYSNKAIEEWLTKPMHEAARIIRGHYPRGMVNRELKAKLGWKEPVD